MKKIEILLLLLLVNWQISNAQVGIGTLIPNESSILDLTSNSQGLLTPRMTTDQRNLISNPATGLLIYNITTSGFNYYDAGWKDYGTFVKWYSSNGVGDIGTKTKIVSPSGTLLFSISFLIPRASPLVSSFLVFH